MIYYIAFGVWWVTGIYGFLYWESKKNDITLIDLIGVTCIGILGHVLWVIGWLDHGGKDVVIIHTIARLLQKSEISGS